MAAAWEMRPVGCVKRYSAERAAQNAELGIELVESLHEVLAQADFVTVHVPLKDDTRHLIGGSELAAMKPDSILVNTSRGGVVDEDALLEALTRGDLAGAGLDVHEREGEGVTPRFAGLPNVVLTPHIGGMATDAQRDIGLRVIEMIDAFVADSLDVLVRDGELVV
jgi:phosphoglycerate dehydrogenase-like enzyme